MIKTDRAKKDNNNPQSGSGEREAGTGYDRSRGNTAQALSSIGLALNRARRFFLSQSQRLCASPVTAVRLFAPAAPAGLAEGRERLTGSSSLTHSPPRIGKLQASFTGSVHYGQTDSANPYRNPQREAHRASGYPC